EMKFKKCADLKMCRFDEPSIYAFAHLCICTLALLFRFFHNRIYLDYKAENDKNGRKCNPSEAENFRVKNSRVCSFATAHTKKTNKDDSNADQHDDIIFFSKSKILLSTFNFFFCHVLKMSCQI